MVDFKPAEQALATYNKDIKSGGHYSEWENVEHGRRRTFSSDDGIKYTIFHGERKFGNDQFVGYYNITTFEKDGKEYVMIDDDLDGNFDRVDIINKEDDTFCQYFDENDDGDFDATNDGYTYESKFKFWNPMTWFN